MDPACETTSVEEEEKVDLESLRPITQDHHHQDSLFGNSFQSKAYFVVHPEWISESVSDTESVPMNRPPWPWEQPRYRQNVQIPITYDRPEEEQPKAEHEEEKAGEDNRTPPLPYHMGIPQQYSFTQPSFEDARPLTTQFGAPIVDTSAYRLSY